MLVTVDEKELLTLLRDKARFEGAICCKDAEIKRLNDLCDKFLDLIKKEIKND